MNADEILNKLETDMMRISSDFHGGDKIFSYMTYEIIMDSEGEPKPIRRSSIKSCVWDSIDYYKPGQILNLVDIRKSRDMVKWLETYMIEMSIYRSPLGKHIRLDFEPFDYDMESPPILTVRTKSIRDAIVEALSIQMSSIATQDMEADDDMISMFKRF